MKTPEFANFEAFFSHYRQQHSTQGCRRMHCIGTGLVLLLLVLFVLTWNWYWLLLAPFAGYGFAWLGHVCYEKNIPATFKHPWYSLRGDWRMFAYVLRGKIKW